MSLSRQRRESCYRSAVYRQLSVFGTEVSEVGQLEIVEKQRAPWCSSPGATALLKRWHGQPSSAAMSGSLRLQVCASNARSSADTKRDNTVPSPGELLLHFGHGAPLAGRPHGIAAVWKVLIDIQLGVAGQPCRHRSPVAAATKISRGIHSPAWYNRPHIE